VTLVYAKYCFKYFIHISQFNSHNTL
jgi:hypothetical protein